MVQRASSIQDLTGEVEVVTSAEFGTDTLEHFGGTRERIHNGRTELSYDINVSFREMYLTQTPIPMAVHNDLQRLALDRNYPEFLRAMAAALEGDFTPPDAIKIAKPKKKRKAKKVNPPKPKRNIRFLDQ